MKFHAECIPCLTKSALNRVGQVKDDGLRVEYMRGVCRILSEIDPEYDSAALLHSKIVQLQREMLHTEQDFTGEKHQFNQLVLGLYERLKEQVHAAEDPLRAAIQLSMAGNYIDFGVLGQIDPNEALRMLDEAAGRHVDDAEYALLKEDLAGDGELVFLHDNCGEIVLDRLLIEVIKEQYPEKRVLSVVRGGPVLNDATMEDARESGLADLDYVEITGNGLQDIPGTQLDMLPEWLRLRIENAGLVIAKGQGNFESLIDCGLNMYFLFLSKCPSYTLWFGFEHFSGILKNAKRLEM